MKQILIVVFLILLFLVKAQSSYVGGIFPTIDHSRQLNEKLSYGLYYFAAFPLVDLKRPDMNKDKNFLLFYSEQSMSYKINDHLSLTGSYVYQRANVVYDNYVNENRFYVQAKYKHSLGKFNLSHRFRFDGRFIQNRFTNRSPMTHRVRYLIGLDVPLRTKKENLYFTMYQEFFFNTVKGADPVYDENWAYAALGVKLNEKNRLEPGILYIRWSAGKPNWFNQYYLQFTWINRLDLKRN